MALGPNDIQALSTAIAQALRASGGMQPPQRWDPIASRINQAGPPEERAHAMRMSKIYEDNNKLMREMTKMLGGTTRSVEDLKKLSEVQRKTMDKAIDSNKDIDKATQELVKQLQKQLSSQDAQTQKLKAIAGNFKDLKGVLALGDLTKGMAELSKALDASSTASARDITDLIEGIEKSLKHNNPNSKGLQDLDPELKKLTRALERIQNSTRAATIHDVAAGRATSTNQRIKDEDRARRLQEQLIDRYRTDAKRQPVLQRLRDMALNGQKRVIEGNSAAIKANTGVWGTAKQGFSSWTAKVATSAFVLDQLAAAGRQLISTIKAAGGTGTEKGLGGVLKRDFNAFTNGINPDVMQEIQVKGARARTGFGKEGFDKSVNDGVGNLMGVTYDRNEAAKMQQATLSTLFKSGISAENTKNAAAGRDLRDSFVKLQAMTGMTGEQMSSLNDEIASDTQFRQGLMTLSQKERAASIVGITKMFEENAQRNISIEQTKEMIRTQQALSDPHSPKNRIKNAAKLRAMGGAVGIDMSDASDLVLASGNQELMKKRLMAKGMTAEQAASHVKNAQASREQLGTLAEKDLSDNGARGLAMEGMLNATGTKDYALAAGQTLNEAGKLQKEAADKMMDAAIKMAETSNSRTIANISDYIGNMMSTMTGKIIMGVGAIAAMAVMRGRGVGLGSIAGGAKNLWQGVKSLRSAAPGAAAMNPAIISPTSVITAPGVGGAVGPVAVGGAAANASHIQGNAPGLGRLGTVSQAGSKAANAASLVPSTLSRTLGFLGKIATPLAAALAVGGASAVMMDKSKNAQEKGAGVGNAAGTFAGGWAGAAAGAAGGAALGSVVPIIGTGIGAAIGGILGGMGGSALGGWGGSKLGGQVGQAFMPGSVATPSSPASPGVSPVLNTADGGNRDKSGVANKAAIGTKNAKTEEELKKAAAKEAQDLAMQKSLDTMNQTLGSILIALQDQTEDMNDGTNKTISMQDKVRRAFKLNGFSGATPADGAANAYKAS